MRLALLVPALAGCSLYFGPDSVERSGDLDAGSAMLPDAQVCPAPGTYAEISTPLDGATNVATPTPIRWRTHIPNTLDGRGIYLSEGVNGAIVPLDHWVESCSGQDGDWVTSCYDLEPDKLYTWHIWITCYDASGIHEIETSTFRTAP